MKLLMDKEFGHYLRRMGGNPNPILKHIIKKLREGDNFHHRICAEIPELEPLMKEQTMITLFH